MTVLPHPLQRVARSIAFYPVTQVYVAGSGILFAVVGRWVRLDVGLLLFTVFAVLVLLHATMREVAKVHILVNSQRDLLLERIQQLTDALRDADMIVPDERGTHRGPH